MRLALNHGRDLCAADEETRGTEKRDTLSTTDGLTVHGLGVRRHEGPRHDSRARHGQLGDDPRERASHPLCCFASLNTLLRLCCPFLPSLSSHLDLFSASVPPLNPWARSDSLALSLFPPLILPYNLDGGKCGETVCPDLTRTKTSVGA